MSLHQLQLSFGSVALKISRTLLLDIRATTISWHAKVEASHSRIEDKLDAISAWKSGQSHSLVSEVDQKRLFSWLDGR